MHKSLFIIAFTGSLIACTSAVTTDYSDTANYSQYKTYQFATTPPDAVTTLDGERAKDALSTALYTKGLKPVTKDGDLTVRYSILEQTDYKSYGTGFGFGYGYGNTTAAYAMPVDYREYHYGKLVVELISNASNQVVWRAESQRKLTESMSANARREFIDSQINQMFSQYPPP
ncbi:DUF4136 domain-containing protein [Photobacterium nomapromontoriensis]|uniref:DUF4136 domain-containing protein n=1 Tax=Photobacterium nomapromontoriensis TaxID=2910237 RepID=UPI003D124B3F